jgi:hypothetical protein
VLNTHPGNVYWVDSGAGSNSYKGTFSQPWSTLDYAVGRTTASNGDIIMVKAGHAENLALADAVDVDVAGIKIIGTGEGANRPTFTYTAIAGEFVIGAANVTVENIRLVAGISNVAMAISVEAAGDNATLRNIEVPEPSDPAFEFADIIDVATTVDNLTIDGWIVRQVGVTAGDLDHFLEAGAGINNRLTIINSVIEGEFAVSAIWSDTADTEVLIDNCIITNATNGQHAIEFTSTARGSIRNTLVRTDVQGTAVDPGSLTLSNVLWDDNDVADSVATPVVAGAASADPSVALAAIDLDHLFDVDGATQVYPEQAANDSTLCKILGDDDPAACSTYNNATDSLEALGTKTTDQAYWQERTAACPVDEVTADIADIAGGPIWVKNFTGTVTADIGAVATNATIFVDRDDGAADNELSTAVAIATDVLGTQYVFSDANPSVLTPLTSGAAGGGTTLMSGWFVPEGMLEQLMSADPGGAATDHITWYITYVPLTTGVTVTCQ